LIGKSASGTFFGFEIWPAASANRPKNEPKIDMTRTDVRGRTQNYSWKMVRG
jgi:hypothetical protein